MKEKRGKRGRGQGRYENLEDLAEVWHRLPRSAPHTGRPGAGRRSAGAGAGLVWVNAGVDGERRAEGRVGLGASAMGTGAGARMGIERGTGFVNDAVRTVASSWGGCGSGGGGVGGAGLSRALDAEADAKDSWPLCWGSIAGGVCVRGKRRGTPRRALFCRSFMHREGGSHVGRA